MLKNVTGQNITALLLDTDGAAVTTGTTTVYVTGDAGSQASMGTATHEGNGEWSIDVTQAESNYDDIGFTWVNSGAVTVHQHVFTDQAYDAVATAQADLDILTGADGAILNTTQANYAPAKVGDSMALAAGAVTNASLAGNMEIVFETDFATNYNTTRNAWATNVQDSVGTGNLTVDVIAISGDTTAANNAELAFDGTGFGFTNCTIPTITTLTGHTAQTGDTYALANGATGFAAIDTVVDGIQTDLSNGTDGLGALKTLIDAIQTEVELLTTTAHAEPTDVPAANEAPIDKLGYLFMALRNKVTVTATKKTFYDDGDNAEWEKDLSDAAGTYTETEGNAI